MSCSKCARPAKVRGLCQSHYQSAWKAGNLPEVQRKRPPVSYSCPTDHAHADTTTCYIAHKCRCNTCRDAQAARAKARHKAKAFGRWVDPYVPAAPVRAHVEFLRASGMGLSRIAEVSGLGKTALYQIAYGRKGSNSDPRKNEPLKRILAEKAEKLLAVQPDLDSLRPGAYIPARGSHRRVQALAVQGWSFSKIGERIGVDPADMSRFMRAERVTVTRHKAVCAVFDELWDQLPPRDEWHDKAAFVRTVAWARKQKWLSPLAWDDIDLDEAPPTQDEEVAGVDESAVDLAAAGVRVKLSIAEREETVRVLHGMKLNDSQIAERVNVDPRTVLRIRQRLELPANVGFDRQVAA